MTSSSYLEPEDIRSPSCGPGLAHSNLNIKMSGEYKCANLELINSCLVSACMKINASNGPEYSSCGKEIWAFCKLMKKILKF